MRLATAARFALVLALLPAALPARPALAQAAKTRVIDYVRDGAGNPLAGKITFVLTQKSAASPDGLVVASPTVSGTIDSTGKFDVSVYPSASLSPASYYQVYVTSGAGSQTLIGLYNVPASASVVTLSPYKVTDADLAAQYTFAPLAAFTALSQNISAATLATLTFQNVATALGYAPEDRAKKGQANGYASLDSSGKVPTAQSNYNPAPVNITGGTLTGVTCTDCTNVGSATGGAFSAAGDQIINFDSDNSGGGVFRVQRAGVDQLSIANDGTLGGTVGSQLVRTTDGRLLGARKKYASNHCTLDSHRTSGGGTDATACLQAILDTASSASPLHLVVDGVALVTGLKLKSYTILDLTNGGLYLKSGSNRPILRNANQTEGNLSAIVDENIRVIGGFLNGNRDGQVKCNTSCVTGGEYVVGLQFFGVRSLSLDGVHVFNSKNFGVHIANFKGVKLRDVWVEQPDYTLDNYDGVHLNGPGQDLTADETRCTKTSDDCFAINAFDPVNIHVGVTNGPIADVQINGLFLDNCYFGIRLMGSSGSHIDRVSVRNVHGTLQEYWLRMDSGSQYGGSGSGDIRRIHVEGVSVTGAALGVAQAYDEAVRVESLVESLTIKGYKQGRDWYPDYRPMLRTLPPGGTTTNIWCTDCPVTKGDIRSLEIEASIYEPSGVDPTGGGSAKASYRILNEGNITRARIYADNWRDAAVALSKGIFWNKGGTTGDLILSGGANRMLNTVALTSGSISSLRFAPWNDAANGGAVIHAQASGGAITAYPSVSGDLFANAGTVLGGTGAANVTTVQLFVDGSLLTLGTTFAQLPSAPREGTTRWVTDSNTSTWGATVAGGGASKVLAVYNGTNWTVAGK